MAPALQAINLGRQAAVDIFDTINHIPNIDPSAGEGKTPDSLQGEIKFDKVFFSYPTRPKDILYRDFNLVAEAGKSLAIVGPVSKCRINQINQVFVCMASGAFGH